MASTTICKTLVLLFAVLCTVSASYGGMGFGSGMYGGGMMGGPYGMGGMYGSGYPYGGGYGMGMGSGYGMGGMYGSYPMGGGMGYGRKKRLDEEGMPWSPLPLALLLGIALIVPGDAIQCYSCADDFIVWHWRHFFLKRNYGISVSDPECKHPDYNPDSTTRCSSTCFILYLNGTDRFTGQTTVLGVGRGCSTQSLSDDQHTHLGLGTHAKVSDIGNYLSNNFDNLDITEHWCFCISDFCNTQKCYTQPIFSRYTTDEAYLSKRRQYSPSGRSPSSFWRYYGNGAVSARLSAFLVALHTFSLL
ncbi:hypothetical protein QR680_005758 [Steinernema hermaphroditum]|uniref:Uncharacterized protein n=1 Tax=Steinernema hermaphroditum TaxID=289476 RepID=A0AA39LVG4_9BILA|nr:hypothetical protein QR680_005758 [Steinernema hermaphroditum]